MNDARGDTVLRGGGPRGVGEHCTKPLRMAGAQNGKRDEPIWGQWTSRSQEARGLPAQSPDGGSDHQVLIAPTLSHDAQLA